MIQFIYNIYKGSGFLKEINIPAEKDNLGILHKFIDNEFKGYNYTEDFIRQIKIIVDEIFSNISSYAYSHDCSGPKNMKLTIDQNSDEILLRFEDSGVPYNPLLSKTPDITLSVEERNIGGLGIFLVKNMSDNIDYKYEQGKNILVVIKKNSS